MTRPKVDPDKRQRTANACDSCKRRKQKCNGLLPCNTCSKRNTSCVYGASENGADDPQSPKRRMIDPPLTVEGPRQQLYPPRGQQISQWVSNHQDSRPRGSNRLQEARRQSDVSDFKIPPHSNGIFMGGGEEVSKKDDLDEAEPDTKSHCTSLNSHDEEAVAPNPRLSMRMLQDGNGRLLYLGDSATLSFLQLIRMNVESAAGESSFTQDPQRFSIVERKSNLPPNHLHTHLLPERQTANILVESFLRNTNGLIEVFNPEAFLADVEKCYADPLGVEADWLCLLNLTFAIGLVMAAPLPGTEEHEIIENLRAEAVDRSEVFYSNAKHLSDPTTGFEDAGFKSIQALALMSVYTLAVSKRNAAYAYYGMAVRSAFALGLHREETLSFSLFTDAEQAERRNLWRTLFILDRFLSTSLGRPTAIRTSDCSGDILGTGAKRSFLQTPFPVGANAGIVAAPGLAAAVRSCHMIGAVLEKIYSQRKISTRSAQIIAEECKGWPKMLDGTLQPNLASSEDPSQGIAILHVNLLYHHSIVLLTRPFFLFLMTKKHERREPRKGYLQKLTNKYGKFGDQCVVASCLSISLVQRAFEGAYLPRSNPFVMYFLFASTVVVLASEFSDLFKNADATKCISDAITIMQYSAETDPQGKRLLFILQAFRDVVVEERAKAAQASAEKEILSGISPPPIIPNRSNSIAGVGASIPTISIDLPPISSVVNGSASTDSKPSTSRSSRHNSQALDPMLELSRNSISGGSVDESDSMGGEEQLEFEKFFEPREPWGSDNQGYMPRVPITPAGRLALGLATANIGNSTSLSVYGLSTTVFGRS